jgi:hypothetical protein
MQDAAGSSDFQTKYPEGKDRFIQDDSAGNRVKLFKARLII